MLLSPPPFGFGLVDDPRTFLRVPPGYARDSAPRYAAHHISAYGSSNDGFAMQQRCILGMLSCAVSFIRNSKFYASDVFPDPGSNIRHPLSVLPSLHRVQRDQFPGFISTMQGATTSYCHLAALRFLRLAIPRMHSLFSLSARRVHCQSLELVARYLQPGIAEEQTKK